MRRREPIVLASIVLADLVSKLMAVNLLPLHEYVPVLGGKAGFFLIFNERLDSHAELLRQNASANGLSLLLTFAAALSLLAFVAYIRKKPMGTGYKILAGIGLWIFLVMLCTGISMFAGDPYIAERVISICRDMVGLVVWSTFLCWSSDKWIRLSIVTILACGVGNLLSFAYPPWAVVDFIQITGSYEALRIGTFNLADMAFYTGMIGLLLALAAKAIRKMIPRPAGPATENPQSTQP